MYHITYVLSIKKLKAIFFLARYLSYIIIFLLLNLFIFLSEYLFIISTKFFIFDFSSFIWLTIKFITSLSLLLLSISLNISFRNKNWLNSIVSIQPRFSNSVSKLHCRNWQCKKFCTRSVCFMYPNIKSVLH